MAHQHKECKTKKIENYGMVLISNKTYPPAFSGRSKSHVHPVERW
jgi:hypothetical protein